MHESWMMHEARTIDEARRHNGASAANHRASTTADERTSTTADEHAAAAARRDASGPLGERSVRHDH
jgi:hypothetical protein